MSNSAKTIIDQALELSLQERAFIVEQLSLSFARPDAGVALVWAQEAEARVAAYQRGELKAVSLQEVFAKYKAE